MVTILSFVPSSSVVLVSSNSSFKSESLITFLAKNDIVHCSKVANKVRADDIVVRVFSLDDCKQVVEYINKNYADKVMQTNPFLLKDGCVGISADGGFSFNERVANFISEYMTLLSEQDKLKTASREDFKKFIDKRRKEIFIDGTGIEKFIEDKDIRYKGVPNIDYLTENKYIMDLLSISLDKEKGFEDFESYWEEIINPKNREKLKKSIEELVESQKDNISDEKIKEEEKMEENQETEKINDMRFKENEEHDEMAKYETEEWFYDEDTNDEYNKDGYNRDGFNKEGLHRETGTKFAPNGYDKFGFDREGHDIYGDTREEAAKSSDILDAEIKRQYRIKENGFDPDEELEDDNYSEEEQQDGVEINEFGEIIRPNKEETTRQLENMTIEELQKAVQENDRSIKENDKSIKQALIKKLLEQQRTIEKQQLEMDTLNSQKQEL